MVQANEVPQAWQDLAGGVGGSFVEAVNAFDADRLIGLFAQDAYVNDQLRDFTGIGAIGKWIRREVVGAHLCMDVVSAKRHYGDLILSAEVSGDFDKTGLPEPLVLSFILSACDGKITKLIVLLTRPHEMDADIRKLGSQS